MIFNLYAALGVTEGEVFKINGSEYRFVENGLETKISSGDWTPVAYPMHLLNNAEIELPEYKPNYGDEYLTVTRDLQVRVEINTHDGVDFLRFELGLCYRTKEQADREGIPKMKALVEKWGGKVE